MNKLELLACIRTFRQQVISELDRLEDALISLGDEQPQQTMSVQNDNDDWLTVTQVCECLNISQTTFYEAVRNGILPPGNSFGPKTKRWRISEIRAWQASLNKPDERHTPQKKRGRPSRVMNIGVFAHA